MNCEELCGHVMMLSVCVHNLREIGVECIEKYFADFIEERLKEMCNDEKAYLKLNMKWWMRIETLLSRKKLDSDMFLKLLFDNGHVKCKWDDCMYFANIFCKYENRFID